MRTSFRRVVLACFLAVLLSPGVTIAAEPLSGPAPAFSLPTDTAQVSLADLRGKVVYVDFWASWCVPCRDAFPWMNEMKAKYEDKGLIIIAINLDKERDLAKKFLARVPAQFTIAYDPDWTVAGLYKVGGVPSSYLVDAKGVVRGTHLGFREKDKPFQEAQIKKLLEKTKK